VPLFQLVALKRSSGFPLELTTTLNSEAGSALKLGSLS